MPPCLRSPSRREVLQGLCASLALTAPGCRRPNPTTPSDRRIVSISPSTTETLFAIGAGSDLVGRSSHCNHPAEALHVPSVGGFVSPSLEAILRLRPSLVTAAQGPLGPQIVEQLASRGIPTYFPQTESIDQIAEMILGLGDRSQHHHQAQQLADGIRAARNHLAQRLRDTRRPRVLLVFSQRPIVAAGPNSFSSDILDSAYATNAIEAGPRYPSMSGEALLRLDPDAIVIATGMESADLRSLERDVLWGSFRATREKRLFLLDDDTILRPGPRVMQGATALAKLLHPENLTEASTSTRHTTDELSSRMRY